MAKLYIYDEIGPDAYGLISAAAVARALDALRGEAVQLRINSPGGSVFEAQAIYQQLREYRGQVTAVIDGLAASAATYVMLAAEAIDIAGGAMVMIHQPWALTIGNADDHRDVGDTLDKWAGGYAKKVAQRSGQATEKVWAAMDAETWFTDQEALAFGLVDRILDNSPALAASAAIRRYAKAVPRSLTISAESTAGTRDLCERHFQRRRRDLTRGGMAL